MKTEPKKELRKLMLGLRNALSAEEARKRSSAVLENLFAAGLLAGCKTVALYAAAKSEVNTRPLFERLIAEGRTVVLPRVLGQGPNLGFWPVSDWDRLIVSRFGIPEPEAQGEPVAPELFDFVLVPGIAFDPLGGRVGYGMGCYDRVLERVRPGVPLVGMGYDFQLVDRVPMEEHDVPLTAIVIERGFLLPDRKGGDLS